MTYFNNETSLGDWRGSFSFPLSQTHDSSSSQGSASLHSDTCVDVALLGIATLGVGLPVSCCVWLRQVLAGFGWVS